MTQNNFDKIVDKQFEICRELLCTKAQEYTPIDPADVELVDGPGGQYVFGFASDDRLRHFKKAAVLMNCTPRAALFGMLSKHLVSVADMCMSDDTYSDERWTEK